MALEFQDSYVRACHDFPENEQGDLPFASGDVLYVDRQIDRNWYVENFYFIFKLGDVGHARKAGLGDFFPRNSR